jgi:hypothetical protein
MVKSILTISRVAVAARGLLCATVSSVYAQTGKLPWWNDGPAKRGILEFVRATTDRASPSYVPPEDRLATFDQRPTMASIIGVFKSFGSYYGLLIESRPVIAWNAVAVLINFRTVSAYRAFLSREKNRATGWTRSVAGEFSVQSRTAGARSRRETFDPALFCGRRCCPFAHQVGS